jgi:flavin reductase (DIM6/NTAB) family NADH-FMN oxidoreductase RutF
VRVHAAAASLRLLSWLWTPLVVVTASADGRRSGQVAVTAHGASIVAQRPRLSVALWKDNLTHDLVVASGAFAVHLLRDDQDEVVYRFGLQSGRTVDKFEGIEHETGVTGSPLLRDCLAVFECCTIQRMDGGDHTVFLGEVVNGLSRGEGSPLWWRDLRPRIPPAQLATWEAKQAASVGLAVETMDNLPG